MLEHIKNGTKKVLLGSGYYNLKYNLSTRNIKKMIILMYHDLEKDDFKCQGKLSLRNNISEKDFAAHMDVLKVSCRVISIEDAIAEIKRFGCLKENSASITFDDGYGSVYDIAFPVLKHHGFPATVFLANDWINGKMELWWEKLTWAFAAMPATEIGITEIEGILKADLHWDIGINLGDRAYKRKLLEKIEMHLRNKDDTTCHKMVDSIVDSLSLDNDVVFNMPEPLSWEKIKMMSDQGINFGAHTCRHINLKYADKESAEVDIKNSKEEIELKLSKPIRGFAYPYGNEIDAYHRIIPVLRNLGFDYACTGEWGNNDAGTTPFLLRRLGLPLTTSRALLKRSLYLGFC